MNGFGTLDELDEFVVYIFWKNCISPLGDSACNNLSFVFLLTFSKPSSSSRVGESLLDVVFAGLSRRDGAADIIP